MRRHRASLPGLLISIHHVSNGSLKPNANGAERKIEAKLLRLRVEHDDA